MVKIIQTCSLFLTKARCTKDAQYYGHKHFRYDLRKGRCNQRDVSVCWPCRKRKIRILFRWYFSALHVKIVLQILKGSRKIRERLRSTNNFNAY